MRHLSVLLFIAAIAVMPLGCEQPSASNAPTHSQTNADAKVVVLSITSDPQTAPQKVNMGLVFAGFCLDEGYDVNLFLNVAGVKMATKDFPDDLRFKGHDPIKSQLIALSTRGAQVHVCPVCMKDFEIPNEAIIPEAFVTSKPKLFAKLGADTMVMTY